MENQLLSRKQVAEMFAVKADTIRKWQNEGKIKLYCQVNNRPRYRIEDLQHLFIIKTSTNDK
jgi:predicted site-specific integrase-resolvase